MDEFTLADVVSWNVMPIFNVEMVDKSDPGIRDEISNYFAKSVKKVHVTKEQLTLWAKMPIVSTGMVRFTHCVEAFIHNNLDGFSLECCDISGAGSFTFLGMVKQEEHDWELKLDEDGNVELIFIYNLTDYSIT